MPAIPVVNSDFVPRGIDEAIGKRITARALGADGNAGERYFQALGYETRRYGPNWDWTYKKPGEKAWRPINPKGLDAGDIASFIADAVIGLGSAGAAVLTGAATAPSGPGALAAGATAGGLAAGALEAGRQGLGSLAGIPDNVSVPDIAAAGIGGVAGEVGGVLLGKGVRLAGRALNKTARGTAFVTREVFGRFGGVKAVGEMSPGKVLVEGGLRTEGGDIPMMSTKAAGSTFARMIRWIDHHGMTKEAAAVEKSLADAAGNGTKVDIMSAIDEITSHTLTPPLGGERAAARIAVNDNLKSEAVKLMDAIRTRTRYSGRWSEVPVDTAATIKRVLQQRAAKKGAFEGIGPSTEISAIASRASGIVRDRLEKVMATVDPDYIPLMRQFDERMTLIEDFKEALAVADRGPAGDQRRTNFIRSIYGEGKTEWLDAAHTLQTLFPNGSPRIRIAKSIEAMREAGIGQAIGKRGVGEAFKGSALLSGAAVPIVGTVLGGAPGLVAGTALTSPRLLVKAVPTAARLSQAAQQATSALARVHLGGASRVVAVGTLDAASIQLLREGIKREGGGSKGVARQDGPPRRRIYIGGS